MPLRVVYLPKSLVKYYYRYKSTLLTNCGASLYKPTYLSWKGPLSVSLLCVLAIPCYLPGFPNHIPCQHHTIPSSVGIRLIPARILVYPIHMNHWNILKLSWLIDVCKNHTTGVIFVIMNWPTVGKPFSTMCGKMRWWDGIGVLLMVHMGLPENDSYTMPNPHPIMNLASHMPYPYKVLIWSYGIS